MSATQLVQSQFKAHETLAPKNKTRMLSEQDLFFSVFVFVEKGMCMCTCAHIGPHVHRSKDQANFLLCHSVFNSLNLEFTIFS